MRDDVYTEMVWETRVYPDSGEMSLVAQTYCTLGLVGEAGELANQLKKIMRDDDHEMTPDRLSKIKDELGDVLWYVTALADELGFTLGDIKTANADKLLNRKANDTIHGDRRERNEPGMARPPIGLLQILPCKHPVGVYCDVCEYIGPA